uniref:Uncharacterized protein n=1 Tax=Panagrolaimus sp. JU765 TaxID=591449 RepID=A0AC34R346_9BILA
MGRVGNHTRVRTEIPLSEMTLGSLLSGIWEKNGKIITTFRNDTGFAFVWDLGEEWQNVENITVYFMDIYCLLPENSEVFAIFIGEFENKNVSVIENTIVGEKFPFVQHHAQFRPYGNFPGKFFEGTAKKSSCSVFSSALQLVEEKKIVSTSSLVEFIVPQLKKEHGQLMNPVDCIEDQNIPEFDAKDFKATVVLNFLNFGFNFSSDHRLYTQTDKNYHPGNEVSLPFMPLDTERQTVLKVKRFINHMAKMSHTIKIPTVKDDSQIFSENVHKNPEEVEDSEEVESTITTMETTESNMVDENSAANISESVDGSAQNKTIAILQPKKSTDMVGWIPWIANGIAVSILLIVVVRAIRDPNFWADRELHKLEEADHRDTIPLQPIKEENETEPIPSADPIPSTSDANPAVAEAVSEPKKTATMPRSSIEIPENDIHL